MKPILKMLSVLSIIVFTFSCRQIPENDEIENISFGELVSVKIAPSEILWIYNVNDNTLTSENNSWGGGNSLKNNNLNTYTEVLDDGLGVVEVEEILKTPENNKYIASLGLSSNLSEPYPYDVTTVLIYKKIGNKYVFDKVVYVENDGQFKLSAGQNYTLLLHGGRVDENNIYNKEDINNVYIENRDLNFKPLFQRIDNFIPNESKKNVLPVKMKYPGSHVTLVFDATNLLGGNTGKKITLISTAGHNNADVALRGYRHHVHGISFLDGDGAIIKERLLEFKGEGKLSVPIVLGNTLRKDLNITLSFKTEDSPETRTIKIALRNLKKSYKQTYKIKLRRCGAYLGPNNTNWRQFMCHNLGADYNLDPFVPSDQIHGDKYQWGYKDPIIKQEDDVYKSGNVPGWNHEWKWGSMGVWNYKQDPCPDGYRVPNQSEWENAYQYNNLGSIGPWDNPAKNANSGVKFGDNLMLPTAGARTEYGATIENRSTASYWSIYRPNKRVDENNRERCLALKFPALFRWLVMFSQDCSYALPVRCIKNK